VQSISAFLAYEFDRSDSNFGIDSPLPSRDMLRLFKLTIGDKSMFVGCGVDVCMAVESPDMFAVHDCRVSNKLGCESLKSQHHIFLCS
jgi:hypothetical protein